MATLTNVGVWGNGRALEYLLIRLYADPLEEIQTIARAAHCELEQVIGPFVKRANDDKGKAFQTYLQKMRERECDLAREFLQRRESASVISSTFASLSVNSARNLLSSETGFLGAQTAPRNESPKLSLSSDSEKPWRHYNPRRCDVN